MLRELSRIFAALLREHERGVRLVIAEARIGSRHDLADSGQIGGRERTGERAAENGFESFHRAQADGAGARSWKIARIFSGVSAAASRSRTARSFRNFAIEARVRRWVWN